MTDWRHSIPELKGDFAALTAASQIGFPTLNPLLPEFLKWLRDGNWPVASPTAKLLGTASTEIVPHIKIILRSDDGVWKYWVVTLLLPELTRNVLARLEAELLRATEHPTPDEKSEGVDEAILDFLSNRNDLLNAD